MTPPKTLRVASVAVDRSASATMPGRAGNFTVFAFEMNDGREAAAVVAGTVNGADDVAIRVHSECFTGDVMGSLRCDCRAQLELALDTISEKGTGVVIYLRQEGRGIGLLNKVRAYELQDQGHDTVDANLMLGFEVDNRTYEVAAEIINHLGIQSINLMSNNPQKRAGLLLNGIDVRESLGCITETNPHNQFYLDTKRNRCGHDL
ncbi:MAG: GTP cyclohydrolase II [Deltaproteobacteria bacterium]|nr:GTP cyclohydrolase II [Deltaproteobacteria bacterium]